MVHFCKKDFKKAIGKTKTIKANKRPHHNKIGEAHPHGVTAIKGAYTFLLQIGKVSTRTKIRNVTSMDLSTIVILLIAASCPVSALLLARHFLGKDETGTSQH